MVEGGKRNVHRQERLLEDESCEKRGRECNNEGMNGCRK